MAIIDYRCVCGETISLETTRGGQCAQCSRKYAAEVLRSAAAETMSVADLASREASVRPVPVSDDDDERIGRTLGHFRVLQRLGQGGMGSVYQALDESLQRYVALKVIRSNSPSVSDTRQLQRLFQEAIAQARVNHPNVVHIYFVGRDDSSPFLAMELVGGASLAQRLEQGPLPFDEVIPLALQLADALRACLQFDIVHGDIKPSNVLVTEAGTVKLSDFGLATRLSRTEEFNEGIAGTPNYLAPEQATGKAPDMRSDMYSLGVTLFEMTFGKLPYKMSSSSLQERLQMHQTAAIQFPEPWPTDLPGGWRDVLQRLLAKSPDGRYQSYEELLADLKRLQPMSLPRAGRLQRGLAWIVDLALVSTAQRIVTLPFLLVGHDAPFGPFIAFTALVVAASMPLLFSWLQARWGTTPGKKLFQIRIVDRYGLPPSKARLAARGVFQVLPLWGIMFIGPTALLGIGVMGWLASLVAHVTALFDAGLALISRNGRSIHDMMFDTEVVLDAGLPDEPPRLKPTAR